MGNDINTYLGIAINENLDDEIIVTIIATGFEDDNVDEFDPRSNVLKKRSDEDVVPLSARFNEDEEDDDEDGDFPPAFIKNRRI